MVVSCGSRGSTSIGLQRPAVRFRLCDSAAAADPVEATGTAVGGQSRPSLRGSAMPTTTETQSTTSSAYPNVQLLIAGQWRDGSGNKTLAVHDPATGKPVGSVAVATQADLDAACAAALQGFEAWRKVPAFER